MDELDITEPSEIEEASFKTGVINGNLPGDLYQRIPCTIAFTYVRFEVDGNVKACCISPFNMGNINETSFDEVWHSASYYSWRAKFLHIHKRKFHLKDSEFGFCQICSHVNNNTDFAELLNIKREDE
ncbi:MAG: SPASM domain-containing protein [Rhizobacter sp.]|nr:SPASM domain-containing protein [Bacteriovorax sp.]